MKERRELGKLLQMFTFYNHYQKNNAEKSLYHTLSSWGEDGVGKK